MDDDKTGGRGSRPLHIIGFGPGDDSLLSGKAKDTLKTAQRILNTREMPLGDTAVLVSGDCGFFSVTKMIIKDFSGLYEIEVVPGIGSIQYFSAKIKVSYDDATFISLHGRNANIVPKVAYKADGAAPGSSAIR
jgi:precorrin-6B methylase 1